MRLRQAERPVRSDLAVARASPHRGDHVPGSGAHQEVPENLRDFSLDTTAAGSGKSGTLPRRGRHIPAQGNALGTESPREIQP